MATDVGPPQIWNPPSTGHWWNDYHGRISPGYLELIEAESHASRIVHFHPIFVPGLLQTREYARAITPATTLGGMPADEVDTYVQVRMRRQQEVVDGDARLVLLLDETSLYRRVGGVHTMLGQLDHLERMPDRRNLTLVVIPRAGPPHPGLLGAFMLCQYDDRRDDVLCFDGPTGNVVIRGRTDLTSAYGELADRLAETGLRDGRALATIRAAKTDFS